MRVPSASAVDGLLRGTASSTVAECAHGSCLNDLEARMANASTGARGPKAGVSHVERVLGVKTGQWVLITCDCPIGEDHTYSDWLARFSVGV